MQLIESTQEKQWRWKESKDYYRQVSILLRMNLRFALSDRAVAAKMETWSRGYNTAGTSLPD